MAKTVLTNCLVLVNGVDLSANVSKVTTEDSRAEVDVTAMGASNTQTAKGLGDGKITIDFFQDFGTSSVHQTLQPLISSSTPVAVEVRPNNAARSATNPAILLSQALMFTYPALDGAVGDASDITVEFSNGPAGPGMSYPTA